MKSPEKLWQGLITTSQNQDDVSWLHPPLWPPWRRWLWELLSRFSPSFLLPWKRSPSWHNPGGLATKVFRLKISEYFVTHIRPVDALRTFFFFFFSLSLEKKKPAVSGESPGGRSPLWKDADEKNELCPELQWRSASGENCFSNELFHMLMVPWRDVFSGGKIKY